MDINDCSTWFPWISDPDRRDYEIRMRKLDNTVIGLFKEWAMKDYNWLKDEDDYSEEHF